MVVYLVTNQINGKQYVGAEKRDNAEYFGSGKLIREAIERFGKENFRKEILVDDKYIDSWEECLALESACILSLNTLRPNGYNILFWNWPISVEICSEAGKRAVELRVGIHAPGVQSNAGKKTKELGIAIFAPGMRGVGGKISGKMTKELRIGLFAPGMQSKGGKRVHELRPNHAREIGKMGGKRTHELHPEKQKRWCGKAGKIGGKIGGKNHAHVLFEIDGLIQRVTLGTMMKEML